MKQEFHEYRTSNALEWDTMLSLVRKLYRDGDYRMSLLIGCGAFFGLRISDTLSLYRCYKDAAKEKNEIEKTFFPAYFFSFSKTFRIFAPSLLSKAESQ